MEVTGIILAGGKSTRMGTDKGLLQINNLSMMEHVMAALKKVTSHVIIISNNKEYEKFGIPVYPDIVPDKGPIGGIFTGLHHSKTELNICVSCDTPFVTAELFKWLLRKTDTNMITIPAHKGNTNQSIGIYKKGISDHLKKCMDKDHLKLMSVIKELDYRVVEAISEKGEVLFEEEVFLNINDQNDLARISLMDISASKIKGS